MPDAPMPYQMIDFFRDKELYADHVNRLALAQRPSTWTSGSTCTRGASDKILLISQVMLGLCFLAFVLGFPSGVALTRFIGLQVGNLDFAECSRGVHLLDSCGVHFLFQHQRWNFEEKPSHTVW